MDLWKYYDGDLKYPDLNKRFPLGEPVIAKSTEYSKKYTQEILKKDFILDGKLICNYEG